MRSTGVGLIWMMVAAAAVFGCDRLTKAIVQRTMTPEETIPIIEGVFHLTYVRNPGAAFGMFAHQRNFFIVITVVVVGLLLYYAPQAARHGGLWPVALGLQLGGALGNFVDRVRWGRVVDFLDFRVWPVFNLADSAIVVGVGVFLLLMWRDAAQATRREQRSEP